jgi:excinuclease ABC subunit C
MKKSNITDKIKDLPQTPGVYFFRDASGKILYIGKATSLRSRVQSYFRGADNRGPWIEKMVSLVEDIKVQETDSVLEALILESNLIKKHLPKYNTMEKDDKSFAYFVITQEEFPRVIILRKTDLDRAAGHRLGAFEAKLPSRIKDVAVGKVYGPYLSKYQMEVALKIIRRIFPFHALKQKTEKGCLDFQLGRCPGPYAGAISKEDYKKNIRAIAMILEGKKKRLAATMKKEMKEAAKQKEFEKAAEIRNKIYALNHIRDVALVTRDFERESPVISNQSLVTSCGLPVTDFRIEAYDISNISGQNAVGSMVVFENGEPDKSQYRKFKIKTIEGSDDVGSMKEVLSRRFNNDWPMPDLILLDGGQGHLNMAEKLLHEELGLAVNIVAVAKGPTRKKLDIRSDANLRMNPNLQIGQILKNDNLIKSIMDEAHRFAITFHRKLRRKNALK